MKEQNKQKKYKYKEDSENYQYLILYCTKLFIWEKNCKICNVSMTYMKL